MKRRVAHSDFKTLVTLDDAFEYESWSALQAQVDRCRKRVGLHDALRIPKRNWVYLRTHKPPTVFVLADQWVNGICSHANIQYMYLLACWNHIAVTSGQQVGKIVQVIRPTRYGRTQVTCGNIPSRDAVIEIQQRSIQRFNRGGIGKIYGSIAMRIGLYKRCKWRRGKYQLAEIVQAVMLVARMQCRIFGQIIQRNCWFQH